MYLDQDMHVHSTFSDGRHAPEDVIASAAERGLRRIGFADHVRRDTQWLPRYVSHLESLRAGSSVELVIGVESKLLDGRGTLDLPDCLDGIQRILVADHRLPIGDDLLGPRQVRERLASGALTERAVIDALLDAYESCVQRYDRLQLAHPLSFLAQVKIPEWKIPIIRIRRLACMLARTRTVVEVSERWRCPSYRTVSLLRKAGVTVVASSDAHDARAVGRYEYVKRVGGRL